MPLSLRGLAYPEDAVMATAPSPTYTAAGPVYVPRQPLGLPAGSVRALLALMVVGTVSVMLLAHEEKPVPIPSHLFYLLCLILGSYFAARSHPHLGAPPLHLPRGLFRFLILAGFSAVIAWGFYNDPQFAQRLTPSTASPYLLPVLLGAFFLGVIVGRLGTKLLSGPQGPPAWFQDVIAWVALLATVGMLVEVLIRLVIHPSLETGKDLPVSEFEAGVAALVAFYFGARS